MMVNYIVMLVSYLVSCVFVCELINTGIEKWMRNRVFEKWKVKRLRDLSERQMNWYENRVCFHESMWDMIVGIVLAVLFVHYM